MIKSPPLLAASALVMTLGSTQTATAQEAIALTFDLPEAAVQPPTEAAVAAEPSAAPPAAAVLPIPPAAANPPRSRSSQSLPKTVYRTADLMAIAPDEQVTALLPPPPSAAKPELPEAERQTTVEPSPPEAMAVVALDFELTASPVIAVATAVTPPAQPTALPNLAEQIFRGGTDSLVARAVGSAEGTRTPEGLRTPAFYGHVDPGNGVWNLGTFSYQHGAQSPEEADDKQLQRLQSQSEIIQQKASDYGIELTLAEKLNALDLANQSPRAALSRGGYMDWLAEARKLGMSGSEAILWARTRSFLDPDTQRWNAPGLGNNIHSISRDQERRMRAIDRAVAAYEQASPAQPVAIAPTPTPAKAQIGASSLESKAADFIFSLDLNTPLERSPDSATPVLADSSPTPPTTNPAAQSPAAASAASEPTATFTAPGLAEPTVPSLPAPRLPQVSAVLEPPRAPLPATIDHSDRGAVPQALIYPPDPAAVETKAKPPKAIAETENFADFFREAAQSPRSQPPETNETVADLLSDPAVKE
ncbi:hypothetical protein [Almyronema epifaneia]|uniref:Uncharacterized protein n=1 Tax=Almyronema epifaneia S1 TaxID=2991925 RepID=A0ABW6II21_9CYAN